MSARVRPIAVTDPADPRVSAYRNVRDRDLHRRDGLFMAEGRLVVETLLARSALRAASVLVTPSAWSALEPIITARPGDRLPPVYLAEQGVMDDIVGFHIHRGALAAGVRPEPTSATGAAERARASAAGRGRAARLLVLERVNNHDNVGGLFRAGAALGAGGVVLSPGCADPLYRKAIRVSMGCALTLPFSLASEAEWPGVLRELAAAGWTVAALALGPESAELGAWSKAEGGPRGAMAGPIAVLLGAEGPGLTARALEHAAVRLRIPIEPGVDSLNVVTAGAIALERLR